MCHYKWLHSHVSAIVWLMLSSLFLAKSTGFVLYKCVLSVLWFQSRICLAANLFHDSIERVLEPGPQFR